MWQHTSREDTRDLCFNVATHLFFKRSNVFKYGNRPFQKKVTKYLFSNNFCLNSVTSGISLWQSGPSEEPGVDPTKLFFFANEEFFPFSTDKLGHFMVNVFLSYVINTQT